MNKIDLSLIIPTYNEAEVIAKTLAEVFVYLKNTGLSFEVLVVDDGSTDDTVRIVEQHRHLYENVRIIQLGANIGKGGAIKRGVEVCEGESILFMDADHSVSIDHLGVFMEALGEGYDIVIASIELEGATINDVHHKMRRWAGKLSKILIQVFAVHHNHDTQRGFKLFTRTAAKQLFSQLRILRWGFDIEILVMAQKKKMQIKELPVVWNNSKRSPIGIRDYVRTFCELMQISVNSLLGKYD